MKPHENLWVAKNPRCGHIRILRIVDAHCKTDLANLVDAKIEWTTRGYVIEELDTVPTVLEDCEVCR